MPQDEAKQPEQPHRMSAPPGIVFTPRFAGKRIEVLLAFQQGTGSPMASSHRKTWSGWTGTWWSPSGSLGKVCVYVPNEPGRTGEFFTLFWRDGWPKTYRIRQAQLADACDLELKGFTLV